MSEKNGNGQPTPPEAESSFNGKGGNGALPPEARSLEVYLSEYPAMMKKTRKAIERDNATFTSERLAELRARIMEINSNGTNNGSGVVGADGLEPPTSCV